MMNMGRNVESTQNMTIRDLDWVLTPRSPTCSHTSSTPDKHTTGMGGVVGVVVGILTVRCKPHVHE